MFLFYSYSSLIILVLAKLKFKIYHPLFITYLVWFCVLFSYTFLPNHLYPLTESVYYVITLYLFCFFLGSIPLNIIKKTKTIRLEIRSRENKTPFLFHLVFFTTLFFFIQYVRFIVNGTTFYKELVQGRIPTYLKLLFYMDNFSLVYFFYLITFKKRIKKLELIYVLFYFFTSILKFSKLDIMHLFVGILLVLWINKKITIKKGIILVFFSFVLLSFIHLFRIDGNEGSSLIQSIQELLEVYFLSPVKALDMVINKEVILNDNKTFVFIERVLERVFKINPFIHKATPSDGWVYVPYPTNVYTSLCPFYYDFGLFGIIIFGVLLGFLWTYLYLNIRKPTCYLIFISLFYILVFQFFADMTFYYMSNLLQILFISMIIVYLKKSKKRNHLLRLIVKIQ